MDLDINYFKIKHNNVAPKQGKILISEPFLQDTYFKRSVVLLTEHIDEEGSVGFILNKPLDVAVSDILFDFPSFEAKVGLGGPVNNDTIHYIHTIGDKIPNSVKILDGVYWGGNFEVMKLLVRNGIIKPHQIRFFVGYSGWAPKQLKNEITRDSWVVSSINADEVMNCNQQSIWKDSLHKLGKKYGMWSNFPENPSSN